MTSNDVLIKGGHVVDPATGLDGRSDILIKDGKIKAVSNDIKASNNTLVIDATNKHVIPGLIDCHVHLREPGMEYKETIETGSRAAAMGGYTTLICEPNTIPPIDSLEMVASLMEKVCQKSKVNIYTKAFAGLIFGVSKNEEINQRQLFSLTPYSIDRVVQSETGLNLANFLKIQ